MMIKSNLRTFCVLPWIHRFINIQGEVQVCCSSEDYANTVKDDEFNKKMYIQDGYRDFEILNTRYMRFIRMQMLAGEWPELCQRCKLTEEMGEKSRRQHENEFFHDLIDELIKNTKNDGAIDNDVHFADYRLGNLCNLKCRMCNPSASNHWIKSWSQIMPNYLNYSKKRTESFRQIDWYEKPIVLENFKSQLSSLRRLHFAGGEPFYTQKMREMLQICIDEKVASNIVITYNTNITLLPPAVLDLWKHFKGVDIYASIDAFGALNDYIRYPSRWEDIDYNLKFLDQNFLEYNIKQVLVCTTVSAYNILHLSDLYQYMSSFSNIVRFPILVDLVNPDFMQTQILPEEVREIAITRLFNLKEKIKNQVDKKCNYFIESIDSTINIMKSDSIANNREELFEIFLDVTKKTDISNQQDCSKVIPELKNYYR